MKNHKCPRCSGKMFVDSYDEFDEEHCLNCGCVQYIPNSLKNKKSYSSSFRMEHNVDECKDKEYEDNRDHVKDTTNASIFDRIIFKLMHK